MLIYCSIGLIELNSNLVKDRFYYSKISYWLFAHIEGGSGQFSKSYRMTFKQGIQIKFQTSFPQLIVIALHIVLYGHIW